MRDGVIKLTMRNAYSSNFKFKHVFFFGCPVREKRERGGLRERTASQ